jgi:exocyst complex component 3
MQWFFVCVMPDMCAVQGRLDVDTQCRGFLELAKEAVSHLAASIFSDAAFIELFHKAFASEEWQQGVTTASILATVGDYLEDFEHLIEAFWFKRCGCSYLHSRMSVK